MSTMRDTCPVCGGCVATLFMKRNRFAPVDSFSPSSSDFGVFYDLFRCDACHAVYAATCPTPDDMMRLYQASCHDGYMVEENNRCMNFRGLLGALTPYLDMSRPVRILDVGAATGLFLDTVRRQFPHWTVAGIEASTSAVETCRRRFGIALHHGMFESATLADDTYDIITMLDVIEHAGTPMEMIAKASQFLAPGGLLVLTTPNIGSWTARLFRSRWWDFRLMHTVYFSRLSMRQMLARGGFRVLKMRGLIRFFSLRYCLRHLGWTIHGPSRSIPFPLALGDMMVIARKEASCSTPATGSEGA